jgi:thymidylate kinase
MDEIVKQEERHPQGKISLEAREARRLFQFLQDQGVEFVVVGDVREYETEIDSDIDMVVSSRDLERLPLILRQYCEENGWRLVQILRHEASALYFALASISSGRTVFLHPDVCADYIRNSRKLQREADLLDGRIESPVGFWIPDAPNAFAYYLMKKLDKNSIDSRQLEYLADLRRQDKPAIDGWLDESFGSSLGDDVRHSLDREDLQSFKKAMPAIYAKLISSKPIRISDRIKEWVRLAARITRPTGVMIGFLGPDGVGKSSVIAEVERQMAPAFRRKEQLHLRPHFGRSREGSAVVTDPHAEKPRGLLGSTGKLLWWWLDYVGGYFRAVHPKLIRSTLVIFDRYADDLAVDPKRYRYGGPLWLARLLARAVPRPDLMFVLVADPVVIQARKAEVPLTETVRQVEEYRKLAQKKGVVLVDAGRPLEEVVANIVENTLKWMERRTHKRLGLKP